MGWDEYVGFVVAAESPGDARILSYDRSREDRWLDETQTSVEVIGESETHRGIVLDSFRAG